MVRTPEEENEYLQLDYKMQRRYDLETEYHPSYSHEQIMKILALSLCAIKDPIWMFEHDC